MSQSRLIELSYYDPQASIRLTTYADTLVLDRNGRDDILCAARFGGYPEMVRAMSDAMYGGVKVEAAFGQTVKHIQCKLKGYQRQLAHDGVYATATILATDDAQCAEKEGTEETEENARQQTMQPRSCYIFCPAGDRDRLFEEIDRKTAAPMIPSFRDYLLETLIDRGDLRQLTVFSLKHEMDAWVLKLLPEDKNVVEVLEQGLQNGSICIPGAAADTEDGLEGVESVTGYLNTFGITVADRIRSQFNPLFDPAKQPLSEEILTINDYVREKAGYSLYDAQLAVAEAVKRQLQHHKVALIRAECGSGKTKIGSAALGALHGLQAARHGNHKSFGLVMAPSHVTKKWVREIAETLPETYGMVVRSLSDLDRLYEMYEQGDKSVYAVFSKEKARDGYMHYPAVVWNRRRRAFLCPDCMSPIEMELSEDGVRYVANADQFFFQAEHKKNHICPNCKRPLWAPVVPGRKLSWVKIGGYGWVYREQAAKHLEKTKNEAVRQKIREIMENPDGCFPTVGASRRYPLSTYLKKKYRGKVDGFLCDELHQYNNASGQGDAMGELYGVCRKFVGMTATLINGYSSGIFHLLYRIVPHLMLKDGKDYASPNTFEAEYGVVENTYEIQDADYNSNRRAVKRKKQSRQLPGVSPLVFSRFLLENTAFLSLADMGKDLPDYEEIPIPLQMPKEVAECYRDAEQTLRRVLRTDKRAAKKILSAYLNLLTVYPDQPYDQPEIVHPESGEPIVIPEDVGSFDSVYPKEEKVLEIAAQKIAAGEKVLIFTSWTRTDSQQKLAKLLRENGMRTEILPPTVSPEKREAWVEQRLANGMQVLITNPACVETGLDLNAFTTILFYSLGYNLFTLRQASRRSWRINQTAPRVEVYLLYYADTMQAKAMKLMASKLAVAGIIEGTFSDEGLAAMSDVADLMSVMAKELTNGIKDNVEDIAAAYKRMAVINPQRTRPEPKALSQPEAEEVPTLPEAEPYFAEKEQPTEPKSPVKVQETVTEEPKKKQVRKVIVNENQLSFFDFAA